MMVGMEEVEIGEGLVRSLLADQHPDLADLTLAEADRGWDNAMWRLGDELAVRLPCRREAAPLIVNEQRWLPVLAPRLPLPVPAPVRVGRPCRGHPWPWSIVPWLPGVPADRAPVTDRDGAGSAEMLGRFLRALHHEAPADAPYNPYRSVTLAHRADAFEACLARLGDQVDVDGLRRIWHRAVSAGPWDRPATWVHGDLHPANVLVDRGTICAVVDFGDLCAGDPATDLAGAWLLLPPSALPGLVDAYGGVDADLERRALGWAVLFALMLLEIGLGGTPTYATAGRLGLERAIERGA